MKITVGNKFRDEIISRIDTFGDKARLSVVGDAARIEEYRRAKEHAEAYRDAGFTGDVPSAVAAWADAKAHAGWTAQQAAEDILATSAAWYYALDSIRALRLKAKEDVRIALSKTEAETICTTFEAQITTLLQGML